MTRQYQIRHQTIEAAWKLVRANKGAAGIDGQTIEDFEENLENNLYKIWNRMTSGSYFPPAVRTVYIPKSSGGKRMLGIPTVSDRVAQQVAKMYLEPILEPKFHNDSYGYRPGRSQHDALAQARRRCWEYDWVLEIDIKGYFDNIDFELIMALLKQHTAERWILLYVERWLKADLKEKDGTTRAREKGTPQGSVISPILSNIFLHHVFDTWMKEKYPNIPFERYADDAIIHCKTKAQAEFIRKMLIQRLSEWKLEINPDKTRIVYCKDGKRTGGHTPFLFTFLGYTFMPRRAKSSQDGSIFISYQPAISHNARLEINAAIRDWELGRRTQASLNDIRDAVNLQIAGWLNYYGKFYKSALNSLIDHIDERLVHWAVRKYKSLKRSKPRARLWLNGIKVRQPKLFAHWSTVPRYAE
jgi:group II intron reverse transcriptase/maturase